MKSDVYFFTAQSHTYKESMSKVKGPLALIQMVDNAKGVIDHLGKGKIFYVNYAIDITAM